MKVGIITFSNASNIGAVLQAFSLQSFIMHEYQYEVVLINYTYTSSNVSIDYKKSTILQYCEKIRRLRKILYNRVNNRLFDEFRHKYLFLGKEQFANYIPENAENCDVYITGSDQVWNTDLNGKRGAFYLDFVNGRKKIAYSASVGRDLTETDKEFILQNLHRFDKISVRENSLSEFLGNSLINNTVTVDPVFLQSDFFWRNIERRINGPKPYIFCYVMENSLIIQEKAKEISKKLSAKIIWVNGGGFTSSFPGKRCHFVGPREFLYLIDNSLAVVTNSFHGAAFSVIFKKPLYIVAHSKRNERLVQLALLLNQKNKIIYNLEDVAAEIYPKNSHPLFDLIDVSKQYLNNCLM